MRSQPSPAVPCVGALRRGSLLGRGSHFPTRPRHSGHHRGGGTWRMLITSNVLSVTESGGTLGFEGFEVSFHRAVSWIWLAVGCRSCESDYHCGILSIRFPIGRGCRSGCGPSLAITGGKMGGVWPGLAVSLASRSAVSFPGSTQCPGTHCILNAAAAGVVAPQPHWRASSPPISSRSPPGPSQYKGCA